MIWGRLSKSMELCNQGLNKNCIIRMFLIETFSNIWRYFWLLGLKMLLTLSEWRLEVLPTPHNAQKSPTAKPYPVKLSILLTKKARANHLLSKDLQQNLAFPVKSHSLPFSSFAHY